MGTEKKANEQQTQGSENEVKIYGPAGSTLQTPEEHRHDQNADLGKSGTVEVSNDDLRKTDIDRVREQLDGKRGDIQDINDTLSNDKY